MKKRKGRFSILHIHVLIRSGTPVLFHTDTLSKLHKMSDDSPLLERKLSQSVAVGELSKKRAMAAAHWVDKEVRISVHV